MCASRQAVRDDALSPTLTVRVSTFMFISLTCFSLPVAPLAPAGVIQVSMRTTAAGHGAAGAAPGAWSG